MDPDLTVGRLAADRPAAARVLARHRIDYCWGGDRALAAACAEAGVNPEALLAEVDAEPPVEGVPPWTTMPVDEVVDEIARRYHRPLDEELPRLDALAGEVAGAHGEAHPELLEVRSTFRALAGEMTQHMAKEDGVLFPMIRQTGSAPPPPIFVMRREHVEAQQMLDRLRRLTGGYAVPADACGSYRALYEGLEALERDLIDHIHVENNILFPRVS